MRLRVLWYLQSTSKHSGSFGSAWCSAWWISSDFRCPFSFVLNLMQSAMKFLNWLKLLYCLQSNTWSSLLSVTTVLAACSASTSFTWHHGFGQFSSSVCCHAGPFNHLDSLRPSMDILQCQYLHGFQCL